MAVYDEVKSTLRREPRRWLITGVAGFVGSHLLEQLLRLDQEVVGIDNFSTGSQTNLDEVRSLVGERQWRRFSFVRGDIRNLTTCREVTSGIDIVLHQAALGVGHACGEDPLTCNDNNLTGTLNILLAACDSKVKRVVYAVSCAVADDRSVGAGVEGSSGTTFSATGVTSYINEMYADVFTRLYDLDTIGLRYVNVFGPRQSMADGPSRVIPRWIAAMLKGDPICIQGNGESTRAFCYVDDVVQINLLAATAEQRQAVNQVYSAAPDDCTTMNELFLKLRQRLLPHSAGYLRDHRPAERKCRKEDVVSPLEIAKARRFLGYEPSQSLDRGLDATLGWYLNKFVC